MTPRPGDQGQRWITVEADRLATRAAGDDRIPVAISSDAAVSMPYGREILVHSTEAVDLSYASAGLPFMADHNTTRQIGSIENVRLSRDGKLRGMLRKGNHPDADWIFRDIEAGIRPNMSVDYLINAVEPDAVERDLYRVTRWTPVGASSVSIPADITVGVGRSAEPSTSRGRTMSTEDPSHLPGERAVTLADQRQQIASIYQLAAVHDMAEHAPSWVERGLTVDQVKAEIFDRVKVRGAATQPLGYLDMSPRDAKRYSAARAIMSIANQRWNADGGLEKEASDAIAKRGMPAGHTNGFFVPWDLPVQTRTAITGNIVATSSLGGAGVATQLLPLIEILRNRMLVQQLGATVLSGLTGNVSFPRQITANTLAWEGENPATAHAHTAGTFDNVTLSLKSAMASSSYSRQLLIQESFDISSWVQNDLATVAALGLDLAALDGTGSNNQPTGVMRQSNVGTATFTGNNGGIPTYAELVAFLTTLENANAPGGNIAWVTNPTVKGKLRTILKSTTAGSAYIWGDDNTIAGVPAYATKQIPSNYTAGTSTTVASGVVVGNWAEALIGLWGPGYEVVVDPYSSASQGMVNVTQFLFCDIGVRHPASFVVSKTALVA